MKDISSKTIGSIVRENFQFSTVFTKYGIDFCCGGGLTVGEAVREKNISLSDLQADIEAIEQKGLPSDELDFSDMPLDILIDYILETHHTFVSEQAPIIDGYLKKIALKHGDHHPELKTIQVLFSEIKEELESHMKKEEQVLFPAIKDLVSEVFRTDSPCGNCFHSIEQPISVMEHEHETVGETFGKISDLSHQYTLPENACNTYQAAFVTLKAFEEDLHKHIHLENNILFPRAREQEKNKSI